jgi:hypothetical protein
MHFGLFQLGHCGGLFGSEAGNGRPAPGAQPNDQAGGGYEQDKSGNVGPAGHGEAAESARGRTTLFAAGRPHTRQDGIPDVVGRRILVVQRAGALGDPLEVVQQLPALGASAEVGVEAGPVGRADRPVQAVPDHLMERGALH